MAKFSIKKFAETTSSILGEKETPNYRTADGTTKRTEQVITWRLPTGNAVQMYVNPKTLTISEEKQINQTRTKGGFVIQYWGANLTQIRIAGTTGSSGIQGINVLRDVYLAENRAFDLVSQSQMGSVNSAMENIKLSDSGHASSIMSELANGLNNSNFIMRPSLGSLATSVLMFYQGVEYKGFFRSMQVTEDAEQTGLFNYEIQFTATEMRGRRENVFAWQKEPLATDISGQLINGIGNAIRGLVGLTSQGPESYSPFNAPWTFGSEQTGMAAALGATSTEQRNILTKGKLV